MTVCTEVESPHIMIEEGEVQAALCASMRQACY
jgi:hypothetical protein